VKNFGSETVEEELKSSSYFVDHKVDHWHLAASFADDCSGTKVSLWTSTMYKSREWLLQFAN